jgi:hypothetical protein
MTSGAPVEPSRTIGGGVGPRALRTPSPLPDRFGAAVRYRGTGFTR